jgi:protein-S-isoprenylcysteine O-methyltransferase Ste14
MDAETHDIRRVIFKYRSYTPIPFLVVMVVFAAPTALSLALGLGIVACGECIRFWGVSIVGSETRTTGAVGGTYLITTGPFAYVRNPLYLGNMLVYTGVGVMARALFPWLPIVALLWFYLQYYLIVTKEEEFLAQRFGEAYEDYKKNVWRFWPRIVGYRTPGVSPKSVDPKEGFASERRTLQAIVLVTLLIFGIYVVRQ